MAAGGTERAPADAGSPLRLEPDLAAARDLAGEGNVVPVRLRLTDDVETPVSAFLKLRRAAASTPCFLLESAEQGQVGRYSFLGFRPRATLRWDGGELREWGPEALAGRSASSPTTSCGRSSRSASRTRIPSACPTWR